MTDNVLLGSICERGLVGKIADRLAAEAAICQGSSPVSNRIAFWSGVGKQ